ncbi:hypothetical protein M758_10G150900 [Ceratodon purpureus]|uniref:Uncharacterized protein n=1 Tax=Ceratodon purpureus TaxID=3225 RepID=A0A8T0GM82_CERPU|nr:hypothetical protein KC19_10G155900 [Ceratodon purpureus]KAG0604176.1 hypothetical protein M758_10G150900 [Ceratodon purpureus]
MPKASYCLMFEAHTGSLPLRRDQSSFPVFYIPSGGLRNHPASSTVYYHAPANHACFYSELSKTFWGSTNTTRVALAMLT